MAIEPSRDGDSSGLADVIDRILDKGLVINADIAVSVAGVELLGIKIRAALASFETAAKYGGCILAIPASDTVKTIDEHGRVVVTMKRDMMRMAQTPQAFHYHLVLDAHKAAKQKNYVGTDDAELVEIHGGLVQVIQGDPLNIKITTPTDLKMAVALLQA